MIGFTWLISIVYRAGNLVSPSLGAEAISDVSSSAGPVKFEDLQRILSSIEPGGVGSVLKQVFLVFLFSLFFLLL